MGLGDRLKKLRKESGISQLELAKQLQISNVTLSRYETNKRSPDYDTLHALADFFDVTTDYLLGRSNIRNPEKLIVADPSGSYAILPPEIYMHLKKVMEHFIEKEQHPSSLERNHNRNKPRKN